MILGCHSSEHPLTKKTVKIIEKFAAKEGKVFFLEAGDGHEYITDDLWLEDMWGWLIPEEMALVFNQIYQDKEGYEWINSDEGTWWDYFLCAQWEETEDGFEYKFMEYQDPFEFDLYGI